MNRLCPVFQQKINPRELGEVLKMESKGEKSTGSRYEEGRSVMIGPMARYVCIACVIKTTQPPNE